MKHSKLLWAVWIMLLVTAAPVQGFETDEVAAGLGQPIHNDITREGLRFLRNDVRETLAAQHIVIERQQVNEWHFDNCEFELTSQNIRQRYQEVVTSLQPVGSGVQDAQQATAIFGQLLHPVQDFYAHSNWVELGRRDLFDSSLGEWPLVAGSSIFNDVFILQGNTQSYPISRDNKIVTVTIPGRGAVQGLITGVYDNDQTNFCPPEASIPHGAPRPITFEPALSKDEPDRTGYPEARALAVRQTTHEWCRLVSLVRQRYGQQGVDALFNQWVANSELAISSCASVLIDQGHNNYYSLDAGANSNYSHFVAMLRDDGYSVNAISSTITLEALTPYTAFVIPLAGTPPSSSEVAALRQYTEQGGAVLLIADWGGIYSNPSQALANTFGVSLDANTIVDNTSFIEGRNFWVTYSNANFSGHEIMNGLNNIQSFAMTGMLPGAATPLITTDSDAVPAGRAVAVAVNYGAGRVVILGDSNIFGYDDQRTSIFAQYLIDGLTYANNAAFGSNILNWLTSKTTIVPPTNGLIFDDISNSPANWASTDTWGLGQGGILTASFTELQPDATNIVAWTDSADGNYSNNANTSLTTINIKLEDTQDPQLSFATHFDLEAGKDYGYVEASVDGGATWDNIATFTGTSANWKTEVVSLSKYANSTTLSIRFHLISNSNVTKDGWYIDNVRVFERPAALSELVFLPMVTR